MAGDHILPEDYSLAHPMPPSVLSTSNEVKEPTSQIHESPVFIHKEGPYYIRNSFRRARLLNHWKANPTWVRHVSRYFGAGMSFDATRRLNLQRPSSRTRTSS